MVLCVALLGKMIVPATGHAWAGCACASRDILATHAHLWRVKTCAGIRALVTRLLANAIASNGHNRTLQSMPRAGSHHAHQRLLQFWRNQIGYYGMMPVIVATVVVHSIAWITDSVLRALASAMLAPQVNIATCVPALLRSGAVLPSTVVHTVRAIVVCAIVPAEPRALVAHGHACTTILPLHGPRHVPLRRPFAAQGAKSA